MSRCQWAQNERAIPYHDQEWGVPTRDERKLFEFLVLEGAQAGLSWDTILKKREGYREAFDDFDAEKVARYDAKRVEKLLANPGIVRNRLKVASTISNAQAILKLYEQGRLFGDVVWGFVGNRPIVNHWKSLREIPPRTAESDAMSKELKKLGFRFVGSTICYAFMQAMGLVNDHEVTCPRHAVCASMSAT